MKIKLFYCRRVAQYKEEITKMDHTIQSDISGLGDGGYPPTGTVVLIKKNLFIRNLIEVFISDIEKEEEGIRKDYKREGWEKAKKELRNSDYVNVVIHRYHIRGSGSDGEGWAETRAYVNFFIDAMMLDY